MKRFTLVLIIVLFQVACTSVPEGVKAVDNFDINRYLGTWYEIARLDHTFERGLTNVTAQYSLRDDGGVRVLNRGFSTDKDEWKTAEGKAYFVNEKSQGHLKVSFFGPFYSTYVIFELEQAGYEYAFISGYNHRYLWLLARSPTVSDELLKSFVETAKSAGFKVEDLIIVNHDQPPTP